MKTSAPRGYPGSDILCAIGADRQRRGTKEAEPEPNKRSTLSAVRLLRSQPVSIPFRRRLGTCLHALRVHR
jgi:hypothetical protein